MGFLQYLIEDFSNNPKFLFMSIFIVLLFICAIPFWIWCAKQRQKIDSEKEVKENLIKDLSQRVTELESKVGNN